MSRQYARAFQHILNSSIAENFLTRHIFEDFLKLADMRTGIVDMTREAIARRLVIPVEVLNEHIKSLESPDESSRSKKESGRRLVRLDESRDWGWRIVNWEDYSRRFGAASTAERVKRHREKRRIQRGAGDPPFPKEVRG